MHCEIFIKIVGEIYWSHSQSSLSSCHSVGNIIILSGNKHLAREREMKCFFCILTTLDDIFIIILLLCILATSL